MRNLHEVGKPKQLSREEIEKYLKQQPPNPYNANTTWGGTVNNTWTINFTTFTATTNRTR